MRKIKLSILLILITYLSVVYPSKVLAQVQIQNPVGFESLSEIINAFTGLIPLVFTVIFVIVLMYGGFVWLTAGADDEKVAQAKKIIVAGIVGFTIIVLAPAIVQFFGALFGVEGGLLQPISGQ